MTKSFNSDWATVVQKACTGYIANLKSIGDPIEDLIHLGDVVSQHPDKVFKARWLVLSYPQQFAGSPYWELNTDQHLSQETVNMAHVVIQILHNEHGDVINVRPVKLRYGSTEIFNLHIKAHSVDMIHRINNYRLFEKAQTLTDVKPAVIEDDDDWLSLLRRDKKEATSKTADVEVSQRCFEDDILAEKLSSGEVYSEGPEPSEYAYYGEKGNPDNGDVKVTGEHGGVKLDGAKAKFGLVPPDAYLAVAEVMTLGALKYSANNWVGLELSRVLDAMERHINAFRMGEEYAADSKQHHMAHAIANAMMAYHIVMNKPEQDDRLFKYLTPTTTAYDMYEQVQQDSPEDVIRKFYAEG